jgi:hypothetical protein
MKKVYILTSLLAVASYFAYMAATPHVLKAERTGIVNYNGSTNDCSSCHRGIKATVTNNGNAALTSDIPNTGYVPGTTYNMTLTIKTKTTKVGFDVAALNSTKSLTGTISSISSNAKNNSGEVTHTGTNTVTGGSKVINYKWQAPAKGTGAVTFYGAVAINPNLTSSMDTLSKFNTVFVESVTTSADDYLLEESAVSVTPTIAKETFDVNYNVQSAGSVKIELLKADGSFAMYLVDGQKSAGEFTRTVNSSSLKSGIYLVRSTINGKTKTDKVVIEK